MQAGTHKVRASGQVQWGLSKNGNEQIAIQCVVEGGMSDGESFWWVGTFGNADSERITVEGMRALGARLGGGDILDLEGLGSKPASATAKLETYQGEQKWKYSIGSGFGFRQQLDQGGLESLRQKMRGKLIHAASKSGGKAAPGNDYADDDIGF